MALSAAINAFGSLLQRGDGATPENFTTIAEIEQVDGPSSKQEFADVTTMNSTQGFREKIPTVRDGGTVTLTAHYLPNDPTHNSSQGLYADLINGTKRNYQIVAPGAIATLKFAGFVADVKPDFKIGSAIGLQVTLQISGAPTLP